MKPITQGKVEDILNLISTKCLLLQNFKQISYAGLWARYSNERESFLEPGDLESAVEAAEAVGDDNIQKRSQGYVNQESFTHGSSAQRKNGL